MGKVEQRLAELASLDLASAGAEEELAEALRDRNNLVIAKAAKLAVMRHIAGLAELMEKRLVELVAAGIPADKGCMAKVALADALYQMGADARDGFRAGVRCVQLEPVYGGRSDTAAVLRGTCALGLVRCGDRTALAQCADLLGDSEHEARIMAARALAYSSREEAALPLRTKLRCGDALPEVIGECFAALLGLTSDVQYVAGYLDDRDEKVAAEAAMALGSSRCAGAYAAMRRWWDAHPGSTRREILITPLALTREGEAINLLVELVEDAPEALALRAAEALGIYRTDEQVRGRVLSAAGKRDNVARVFMGES